MSEQNEKLTALNVTVQLQDFYKNNTDKGAGFPQRLIKLFAAQQVEHATAELREELEAVKKENKEWKARNLEFSYEVAVKSCVKLDKELSEAQRQRDEAHLCIFNLLRLHGEDAINDVWTVNYIIEKAKEWLSRLSSGETKQDD